MVVGLFLKLLNGIYFRQELDIFFEFIPQFLFMMSIFGYLVFMIFLKWSTDYMGQDLANEGLHITQDNVTTANVRLKLLPSLFDGTSYSLCLDGHCVHSALAESAHLHVLASVRLRCSSL